MQLYATPIYLLPPSPPLQYNCFFNSTFPATYSKNEYYLPHNPDNSSQGRSFTRIHLQMSHLPAKPAQTTSIKVNGAALYWKGDVGSPRVLNGSLDRLENLDYQPQWIRPTILAGIQAARILVNDVATAFEDRQDLENRILKAQKELQSISPTEHSLEGLKILDKLLADIDNNLLPSELTAESIENYKIAEKKALQEFSEKVTLIEQAIAAKAQTTEKVNDQGGSILNTDNTDEVVPPQLDASSSVKDNDIPQETQTNLPVDPIRNPI
jgi:hypothetical protein